MSEENKNELNNPMDESTESFPFLSGIDLYIRPIPEEEVFPEESFTESTENVVPVEAVVSEETKAEEIKAEETKAEEIKAEEFSAEELNDEPIEEIEFIYSAEAINDHFRNVGYYAGHKDEAPITEGNSVAEEMSVTGEAAAAEPYAEEVQSAAEVKYAKEVQPAAEAGYAEEAQPAVQVEYAKEVQPAEKVKSSEEKPAEEVKSVAEEKNATEKKAARKAESATEEKTAEKEKPAFKQRMKTGVVQLLIYFGLTAASIIFWEFVLRFQMGGVDKSNLFFLFFVPAEAMAVAFVNGFVPRKVSRFVFPFTLLLIAVFYGIQMVYYRIFGSLFSVSMLGMGGDAVGNFWWAMQETLIKSVGLILLLLSPAIVTLVLGLTKRIRVNPYPVLLHVIALLLAVGFWIGGSQALRVGGESRGSAYYTFHSSISDTDTTASRVGAMTTSLVEAGSYYLGLGNPDTTATLTTVDLQSITLEPEPISEKILEKDPENTSEALGQSSSEKGSEKTSEKKDEKPVEEYEVKPHIYEEFDFDALAENASRADLRDMYTFFGSRTPTSTNEYTGLLKDYNLIYICAESYWNYAVDERVTPTLYKMTKNGIILNNYYNSFRNTTTNGEYAFSTSLWPDVSRQADSGLDVGSFPQSSSRYMPNGLGDFFAKENVPSYAFHNYYGNYYRRRFSWPNLGYENIFFMNEGMRFTSTWPASDAELMQQSVEKYINEDRFFAYYMTFSGHGPYNANNYMYRKNIEEVKRRLGDDAENYSSEALGYFAGNLELEYGMKYLIDSLKQAGKMENTLIVLTADHYPYYVSEAGRESLAGHPVDEMELYKSSCIMYTIGLEEPIVSNTYCCNVDILPTVLNLFGMDYDSRLFMGTDIFSDGVHKAVLYNKSFITEYAIYDARTGEVEWKVNPDSYDWKNLNSYVDNMSALIDSEYTASVNIIKTNFFYHLWKDSGLMSAEEAAAELNRESSVQSQMAAMNAAEQEARAQEQAQREAQEAAAAEAAEHAPEEQPVE